jgi:hypothetical protein
VIHLFITRLKPTDYLFVSPSWMVLLLSVLIGTGTMLAWSVAKLALLSSRERRRERPSIARALLLLPVPLMAGFVMVLMLPILGGGTYTGGTPWDLIISVPVTALVLGLLAHALTPAGTRSAEAPHHG